jgi:hypothetical protein
LRYADAWQSGELTAEAFDATVDGMWAILRRSSPGTTRDEVIDAFSVTDMLQTISFLALRMRARNERPNGATEPTEPDTTQKPRRSRTASAQES